MKLSDKISRGASVFAESAASFVKVALKSRRPFKPGASRSGDELVILANGPSLRGFLDEDRSFLYGRKKMCVNFAANAPEYSEIQPDCYVLADPHFFNSLDSDDNVARLWKNISRTAWPMSLYIPNGIKFDTRIGEAIASNTSITVKRYNMTPVGGFGRLRRMLYSLGAGMPRPRNVLIPSIMIGIREGYETIYIAGADHTWSKTLAVDDDNRVVSVQPHFYSDNEKEKSRVRSEYAGYHLHDILNSLYTAFRSYHVIADYAAHRKVKIYNITPGSMIDAFPRLKTREINRR